MTSPQSDPRRIEKETVEVRLITASGESLAGHVFVQPYSASRIGREQPADVLNQPGAYFPVQTDEGIVLVAKHAIAEMEYNDEEGEDPEGVVPIGVTVSLNVTMSDGKLHAGSIQVEGPVNTPRVLDFMNRMAAGNRRFLELRGDGRVRLLNRAHIETIRTAD